MKVVYRKEIYPTHDWIRLEDGEIDEFAMSHDFCNGPVCKRCHTSFCVHCYPFGYKDQEPCEGETWSCPSCGNELSHYKHENFCSNCGETLDWE